MALRSVAGKVGVRLVRWAYRDAPPPAVAADLGMVPKKPLLTPVALEQLRLDREFEWFKTKHTMFRVGMVGSTVGFVWLLMSSVSIVLADEDI